MISQETIERFFLQQCSADEVAEVVKYFEKHPQELLKYINEADSLELPPAQLPEAKSLVIWNNIMNETKPKTSFIIYLKRTAVAASVLLVFGIGWLLLQKKHSIKNDIVNVQPIRQIKTFNNSTEKMSFYMSDSSYVELMPKSTLIYPDRFSENKRNVELQGEAYFHVSKNTKMPFTVKSGVLSTKVLGTRFIVKARQQDDKIQILLFEGKIAITSADSINNVLRNTVILIPGDVFDFNKNTNRYSVFNKKSDIKSAQLEGRKQDATTISSIPEGNWYMFNNQELSEVFLQLETLYGEKIIYSKADVKGMTFIGKLDKTDSLEHILNSIALLNNLIVSKSKEGYIVSHK